MFASRARRSRSRRLLRLLAWLGGFSGLLAGLLFYLLYAPAPAEPRLSSRAQQGSVVVGKLARSYLIYAPRKLPVNPALLVVFHGSMGSPAKIRMETGYEFDRLADSQGLIIAYPQGHAGHWNDCRKAADYEARRLNVDDIGFFEALVEKLQKERDVDPGRIYVAGLSNGGQFVLRLAIERPQPIAGAAVVAANLPTAENSVCKEADAPPPRLILVSGTRDPINPYEGGTSSLYGFLNRGKVRSASETARYFAAKAEAAGPASAIVEGADPLRGSLKRTVWGGADEPVVLLTAVGGGHVFPQSSYRPPRLLGRPVSGFNGATAIWSYFQGK